jgi:hypothetical protein
MKTVKKNDKIKRLSDSQAEKAVEAGWKYCPKNEWKKIRDKK